MEVVAVSDPSSFDVPQDHAFTHLMAEIERTRAALRDHINGARGASDQALLQPRLESLRALENFEEALIARSLPIPRQVHADLQMLRGLCGPTYSRYSR